MGCQLRFHYIIYLYLKSNVFLIQMKFAKHFPCSTDKINHIRKFVCL